MSIVAAIVNAYNTYNSSSDFPPKTSLCRRQLLVAVFLGCSSFLESNSGYPEKYASEGNLVGKTKVIGLSFCVFQHQTHATYFFSLRINTFHLAP